MTASITLSRPSSGSGQRLVVSANSSVSEHYEFSSAVGAPGSDHLNVGRQLRELTATSSEMLEHLRLAAGYRRLAAQSEEERAIDSDRRARRDRNRTLRAL